MSYTRKTYIVCAVAVIILGILSRVLSTGNVLFDKYLGDALYAILLYLGLRIWRPAHSLRDHANWAMMLVFAIELFQLTEIPLAMRNHGNLLLRIASIVLGTHFSWLDIVAYAVGILVAYAIDFRFHSSLPVAQ